MDPFPGVNPHLNSLLQTRSTDALPIVPIPLLNDEKIAFDFNAVYQQTFIARRFHNLIDYGDEPARFHTYSSEDQASIRERMGAS